MADYCLITNLTAPSAAVFDVNYINNSSQSPAGINLSNLSIPPTYSQYKKIEVVIDAYVIPVICLIGLIGNVLNVIVLSRRRLYLSMEKLESSVHTGLLALAVSDMLFCISVLPEAFKDRRQFSWASIDFWLLYNTYSAAVINTWLLCSSWITVTLAVCRYFAVCKPLQAQCYRPSMGKLVFAVLIGSILLNLPRYWKDSINSVPCIEGGRSYYSKVGPLQGTPDLIYMWIYFVLAIVVPVFVNIYCTANLIVTLQESHKLRLEHSTCAATSSRNIVTNILCTIIIFYVILVIPAEILSFVTYFVKDTYSLTVLMHLGLAVSSCNALQAINFSFNFLLYCIMNVHFRKVTRDIISHLMPGTCNKSPPVRSMQEMVPLKTTKTGGV